MSDQTHPHHHHHDGPHVAPGVSDGHDYESKNRHYYATEAHQYDSRPGAQSGAERIGRAMINTGLFQQGITTVMDFACGTGLLSRVLAAQDPKSIVGVDISQQMVDQYNKTVSDHGIPPDEMRAVCVPPYEQLEGLTFDVIVCASAYHHLASIDEVTTRLVSTYLKPGGSLLVSDLVHGESTHKMFTEQTHNHIVAHRGGFTEQEIRSTFENAGLKNITFDVIAQEEWSGHSIGLFLARGDK